MNEIDESKLLSIFRETFTTFDDERIKNLTRDNCLQWDSLAAVSILASVSVEFTIEIDPNEFESFTSYSSIKTLIDKKIG